MISIHRGVVAGRRILVRRPSVYWGLAVLAAAGAASSVSDHVARIDAERASWGRTGTVLVADRDLRPGDRLVDVVVGHTVPLALVPSNPVVGLASDDQQVVRRHVPAGAIVTGLDVAATTGPLALVPPGWVAVPVEERPPSGAAAGDHVRVVADGFVLGNDALVVGHVDLVTLVAVPADEAAAIPAAAAAGAVTLLRLP